MVGFAGIIIPPIATDEHLRIAPQPVGDITEAKGHFDCPRGQIDVAWHITDGTFELDVVVPGNTSADIVLPNGNVVETIGSGMHHFEQAYSTPY